MTVVLVSHSMEDVARYVDRIIVMDHGKLKYDDTPAEVFQHKEELEAMGLAVPQISELGILLRKRGFEIPKDVIRMDQMEEVLVRLFGTGGTR